MKVVVSFSGGLDSTVLLAYYYDNPHVHEIRCVNFRYGTTHAQWEWQAAQDVFSHYKQRTRLEPIELSIHQIHLPFIPQMFKSDLLTGQGDMQVPIVPARNMIFASILAGYAESHGMNTVAMGLQSNPAGESAFPDCRPPFVHGMTGVISLASDWKVRFHTPFLTLDKRDIIIQGMKLAAPLHMTRSCYMDQLRACGECGACKKRIFGFIQARENDPVEYAT